MTRSCFFVALDVAGTVLLSSAVAIAQTHPDGADWAVSGTYPDQYFSRFGYSVAGAGDVNGDGFDDAVVGAPREWHGGWSHPQGSAALYLGSTSGLGTTRAWSQTTSWGESLFGSCVASAGDVDGDGYDDVLVGAEGYCVGLECDDGAVFLYRGSASGLGQWAVWSVKGSSNDRLGASVASAGDVNGDGFADVIVGEPGSPIGDDGRALLFLGSASGLSSDPSWTVDGDHFAKFGVHVASAGDVDGDGYDDVVVASTDRAEVFPGSPSGPATTPAWTVYGGYWAHVYGLAVASGDVNADGFSDLAVGDPQYDGAQSQGGRVRLYLGSATGLDVTAAWTFESDLAGARLGYSVAIVGDINADGYEDLAVGAPHTSLGFSREGAVHLFLGSAIGLDSTPALTTVGGEENGWYGWSVARSGDVNGDAYDDMLAGKPYDTLEPGYGWAYGFYGPECSEVGERYCASTINSTGGAASITAWCSTSAAAGSLLVEIAPVPDQFGICFHGAARADEPFGNGYLCVKDDLARGAVVHGSGHVAYYRYDGSDGAHSLVPYVGSTRHFQYWFRDPAAGGSSFSTSDALAVLVLP